MTYTGDMTGLRICSVCGGLGHGPELHRRTLRTTKAKHMREAKKALKRAKAKANAQRCVEKDIETTDSSNFSLLDFLALAPLEVVLLMMSYIITQSFVIQMRLYLIDCTEKEARHIMKDVICEMNKIARTSKSMHRILTSGPLQVELHKSMYCVFSGMNMMRKLVKDSCDFVKLMNGTDVFVCFRVENMSGGDIMISPVCARYNGQYDHKWHTIKHGGTIQIEVYSSYLAEYGKQCRQLIVSPGAKQLVGTTPCDWFRSYKLTCPIKTIERTRSVPELMVLEKVTIGEFRDAKVFPANYKKIKKVTIRDQIRLLGKDPDSFIRRRVDKIQRAMEQELDSVMHRDKCLRQHKKSAQYSQELIDVAQRSIQANIQMLESLGRHIQ